jgi:hyperosmotically inducible protein
MKLRETTLRAAGVALLLSGAAAIVPAASAADAPEQDKLKEQSMRQRQQAAAYVDDTWITTKVKAALVKELKSLAINVDTYRGQVLLSGFVDNEAQRSKALQVASSIEGVAEVKDGMVVKQRPS